MAYRVKNLKDITKPTITPDQTRKIIHGCNTDVLPLLASKFDGKIKYGQQYYDFDDGIMTFFAPKQMFSIEENSSTKVEGWMLVFHPDFIQSYSLAKRIKEYGFFSYANNEALHLSDKEETIIAGLMQNLQQEIEAMIDNYTQDVVVSHIDLLLNYCNRFYNRQFITRNKASNDLFLKFEDLPKFL